MQSTSPLNLLNNAEQYILSEIDAMNKLISKMTYFHPVRKHLEALVYETTLLNNKWRQIKDEALNEVVRMLKKGEKYNDYDNFTITILYHPNVADINIYVKGVKSTNITTFITLNNDDAQALRLGWLASDGHARRRKRKYVVSMKTNYVWQVLLWGILFEKVNYEAIGFTISNDDVKISWRAWSSLPLSYKIPTNKDETFKAISNLPQQQFYESMFTLVLGDGSINKNKISIYQKKKERLELIRKYLQREEIASAIWKDKEDDMYTLEVKGGNALKLAKRIKEGLPQPYKEVIDILSMDSNKVISVYKYANLNKIEYVNKNGIMRIAINGVPMSIAVDAEKMKLISVAEDRTYLEQQLQKLPVKAVIKPKPIKKNTYYKLVVYWSEVKRLLCNDSVRMQIINALQRSYERCITLNTPQDCSKTAAARWLQRLQDTEWRKKHLRCE